MDTITLSTKAVVETTDVKLPDGSMAKEFALPSGGVRVRILPVPPFLIVDALAQRADLVMPDIPVLKIEGIGEKWVPARQGQPEYIKWRRACDEIEKLRDEAYDDLTWDYGVAEWELDGKWADEPPKGWKFLERWKKLGRKPRQGAAGRRVDYIRYAVLQSNENIEACQLAMYSKNAPVQSEEAAIVEKLFRGEEGGETDTGRAAE